MNIQHHRTWKRPLYACSVTKLTNWRVRKM